MFTIALWILLSCLALIAGWLAYQLVLQNGRMLLRLEALERQLAQPDPGQAPGAPAGLPIGSRAPDFELPDLSGGRGSLSQRRGRPVLLIFFNAQCGFCTRMAPEIAGLSTKETSVRPILLVVTTGDREANCKLFEEHGIRGQVLIQERAEVSSKYKAGGTPMGYLIDAEGRIASDLATGSEALLALAAPRSTSSRNGCGSVAPGSQPPQNGNGRPGNRPMADSRIKRDGLRIGTLAPGFRLPRLDGGEISLQEFRGRKLLLVFSDPDCGPCDTLSPDLEKLSHANPAVQVLMVSRGEVDENRKKATQHGITFPVALQKKWEISKLYAMFATPIAYLIDEQGVIAGDVAIGPEPILDLMSREGVSSQKESVPMR
jgi:peroxiredoxin